jgi:hypothetical protein
MTIRNIDIDKLMKVLGDFRTQFEKVDVKIDEENRELILVPVLTTTTKKNEKNTNNEPNINIPTKIDKGKNFTDLI